MVTLVLLALGGCSTATQDADRGDQARLLQSVFEQGGEQANSLVFDESAAGCAADHVVAELGPDRLRELGLDVPSRRGPELSEPPLTAAEGDVVFAAFEDCIDLSEQLTVAFRRDAGLSSGQAACVADRYIDSGVLRDALLAPKVDAALNDRIDATVQQAIDACSADA